MINRLVTNPRCYNHPHRYALGRCSRCGLPYCDECLASAQDHLRLCFTCRGELAESRRYRRATYVGISVRVTRIILRALLVMAVIAAVVLGMLYLVYLIAPPSLMR